MTQQLQPGEAATFTLRRILQEQVACALQALRQKNLNDKAVHEARRQMKKARATLRLLRPTLGRRYQRENRVIRDAARPLSAVRDSQVLLNTLAKLVDRYGASARAIETGAFKRALKREGVGVRKGALGSIKSREAQRTALDRLLQRISRWQIDELDWEVLGKGLRKVYFDGRKALGQVERDKSAEQFHAWRKQAKYFWHQLQILEPIWPGPVGVLADQAHKLADYLGDDHDLFVLREKVTAHPAAFKTAADQGALLALIDRCCAQLREKALVLGRRIYEEKPSVFESRLHQYWREWIKGAPHQ
jgi:CHAD domain-containing protein